MELEMMAGVGGGGGVGGEVMYRVYGESVDLLF